MAIQRDRPYVQFNFLVDLGDGVTEGPAAGFQEPFQLALDECQQAVRVGY